MSFSFGSDIVPGPGDLALNKTDMTKFLKSGGEDRYSGTEAQLFKVGSHRTVGVT